ncbi:MAG: hypothetical protein J6R62_04000 [Rikenellaceae bacterium]|nr:hypothetical protein [Rikenellaceae bacterium]
MVKRTYILLSTFLLSLFLTHLAATTLFSHDHVVGGVKIAHSHPYSSSQHTHTEGQFIAIALLSTVNSFGDQPERVTFESPLSFVRDSVVDYDQFYILRYADFFSALRAPPVC